MLVIFALSITPKKLLHDLVANHRDKQALSFADNSTSQINRAVFNCHCDNLVVESPFTDDYSPIIFINPAVFAQHKLLPVADFCSARHLLFGLRGPPAGI